MLLRGSKTKFKNTSGILLPLTSLPSDYGIGSLGREAFRFIDFLKKSHQKYWQLLPLVPFGKGNSPYCSPSAFAGEILLIDIEMLLDISLLDYSDIPEKSFSKNVDYNSVRSFKLPLLKKAADNFDVKNSDFLSFKRKNSYWLQDYSLFMAAREFFNKRPFIKWHDDIKYRIPFALEEFKISHKKEIEFYEITQFLFYSQYFRLKNYANKNGIKLIGDIPFYVSLDSAEVWSNPSAFRLGRDMTPILVAGVPPDVFSEEGQLWGNPIYDWDYHKKTGYSWWKKRLLHTSAMYDLIRIDHFRAFADFYTIPYGAENAKSGKWEKGAGAAFWDNMKPLIKDTEIIAEDLGGETLQVAELIEYTGFPNMKVLQFAFDSDLKNPFLPKNFNRNCVCYTGTHDNDTTEGWYQKASQREKLLFSRLALGDKSKSAAHNLIAFGMNSRARTVIIPLQDYMSLPSLCRINTPGTESGNWEWRYEKDDLTEELCKTILKLSHGRN